LDFSIVELNTVVCQNNCSGHGQCNQATKHCICNGFWMEDFFRANFGERQSNCDWSILYVIIVLFLVVLTSGILVWASFCICRRCSRLKPKVKRHRYALLEDLDDSDKSLSNGNGKVELLPPGNIQRSSLMQSESDVSSEEETIFINQRRTPPGNGYLGNNNNTSMTTVRKPWSGTAQRVGSKPAKVTA
jgi:hypothetical protein